MSTRTPSKRKTKTAARTSSQKAGLSPRTAPRARGKLSKTTVDHEEIRRWAEARHAHPAKVKGTQRSKSDTGMIRLDFPGYSGEDSLEEISWQDFFDSFDQNELAFVYQEKTAAGKPSNFNKLVSRSSVK